jgi:hypothetical protein
VEHQVGVVDLVVAPDEAAALEVVRCPRAAPEELPLRADERPAPFLGRGRLHRDRLGGRVLDVDLEVVLEVGPDAGQVGGDVDAQLAQMVGGANATEHQQLG